MNQAEPDVALIEDKFAVAQVSLYIFSALQIVVALATATGAVPLGIASDATTAGGQRIGGLE